MDNFVGIGASADKGRATVLRDSDLVHGTKVDGKPVPNCI